VNAPSGIQAAGRKIVTRYCVIFLVYGNFLVPGMIHYQRAYELYSPRTGSKRCSRMEREDNVVLIVIKHYLGVGIFDIDVHLEIASFSRSQIYEVF